MSPSRFPVFIFSLPDLLTRSIHHDPVLTEKNQASISEDDVKVNIHPALEI